MTPEERQDITIAIKKALLTEALSDMKFLLEFMGFITKYNLDARINDFIELLNRYYEEKDKWEREREKNAQESA